MFQILIDQIRKNLPNSVLLGKYSNIPLLEEMVVGGLRAGIEVVVAGLTSEATKREKFDLDTFHYLWISFITDMVNFFK